ncbi:hypothetical protein [Streptomyces sp. NRRL S-646]|uniref:hypothetical protein n=1 Tax=Streptomyces sp. NRRL S-646 TaxID=1463917 RepID=UPI0004C71B7E|nr:hypothetical protein [Streptomyces sp. NRRL S-646]
MAKERVTVCVPPCDPGDVVEAIGAAMAPYDYNRDAGVGDPDVETWWDYWQIDGRGCEFLVVPGHEDDPRLIRGAKALSGAPRNVPPSLCDGGPRALLDLETPRAQAAAQARRAFEAWQDFSAAYPPALPSSHFWARHFADPEGYPRAQLLEDYRTQPVIVALGNNPDLEELIGGNPVARLTGDVEAYVRSAADKALPSNALLTLDGHWLDVANAERRRHFNDYLDALPADTLVVRVLYHG